MNKNKALLVVSIIGMLLSGLIFAEQRLTQRQQAFIMALDDAKDRLHSVAFSGNSVKNIKITKLLSQFLDKYGKLDDELRSSVDLLDVAVEGHHKIVEFLLEQGVVNSDDALALIMNIITDFIPETICMCQACGVDISVTNYFLNEYIEIGKLLVAFEVFDPQTLFAVESFQSDECAIRVDLSEYPMEITLSQLIDALIVTTEQALARATIQYQAMNNQEDFEQVRLLCNKIKEYLRKFQQEVLA